MKTRIVRENNLLCPNCGSSHIQTTTELDEFKYGSADKAISLKAYLPFRKCLECEFEYTDSEAEDLRHEAICRHLGVMTPNEIVALRKKYDLSRKEFSERTRIGEASLARWETGELVQNAAYDNFLYLLTFEKNLSLIERRKCEAQLAEQPTIGGKFKALLGDLLEMKEKEKHSFELIPSGART